MNDLSYKFRIMLTIGLAISIGANAQKDSTVIWKKNFGEGYTDVYNSVTAVCDGVIAVGYSYFDSFNNGDWTTPCKIVYLCKKI